MNSDFPRRISKIDDFQRNVRVSDTVYRYPLFPVYRDLSFSDLNLSAGESTVSSSCSISTIDTSVYTKFMLQICDIPDTGLPSAYPELSLEITDKDYSNIAYVSLYFVGDDENLVHFYSLIYPYLDSCIGKTLSCLVGGFGGTLDSNGDQADQVEEIKIVLTQSNNGYISSSFDGFDGRLVMWRGGV